MPDFNNRRKKKVCAMCAGRTLDFVKDAESLKKYINEKGKILPRRVTGTCALHQRDVSREVKRARAIGILPYSR